jgi:hypothetical protein
VALSNGVEELTHCCYRADGYLDVYGLWVGEPFAQFQSFHVRFWGSTAQYHGLYDLCISATGAWSVFT